MSRRPPSARSPRLALFRALPAVQRAVPGHLQTRAAQPLPRPLPPRQVASGDSEHNGGGADSTAVGTGATAAGDDSTALGDGSVASGSHTTALGRRAWTDGDEATAVGWYTEAFGKMSLAVGYSAAAGAYGVAVGKFATAFIPGALDPDLGGGVAVGSDSAASGHRSVALGSGAVVTADDAGKVKVDSLEIEASSAAGAQTCFVVTDMAGNRWKIGADTSGNPIGLGPA